MKITLENIQALIKGMDKKWEGKFQGLEKNIQKVKFTNSSNTLTINNAAKYLGCSRSTIYNRINDGTIVPTMRGNKHMIPVDQLENLYKPTL